MEEEGGRTQKVYLTYYMKIFAMEELPDHKKAKGLLDRSFICKFVVGRPKYNIKDIIKNAGEPKFKPLYDELLEVRKLLLAQRMLHYNDVIYDVNLNINNRNEELTKPLIRLFRNSPNALAEILPVLSDFLNEKNDLKKNSFESKLFQALENLIERNGQEQESPDTYIFNNNELYSECKKVMNGTDIPNKEQSFYAIDFGVAISHKKITETFKSKFKAKPHQTGGSDNKRCLIFSKDVLDRIAIYYDNPEKIEILPEENTDQKNKEASSDKLIKDGNGDDYNRAANINSEKKEQPDSLTHVTDITHSNHAKALDDGVFEYCDNRNDSNNYNILSNSCNNIANKLPLLTSTSCSKSPPYPLQVLFLLHLLRKKIAIILLKEMTKTITRNTMTLDVLLSLYCLFCCTYKTKGKHQLDNE
jgi:hypothetical protein